MLVYSSLKGTDQSTDRQRDIEGMGAGERQTDRGTDKQREGERGGERERESEGQRERDSQTDRRRNSGCGRAGEAGVNARELRALCMKRMEENSLSHFPPLLPSHN